MYEILTIILGIFGLLQIILFFKLWGMTNDIREIRDKYLENNIQQNVEPQNNLNLKYELNVQVVDVKTGRQMRIKKLKTINIPAMLITEQNSLAILMSLK